MRTIMSIILLASSLSAQMLVPIVAGTEPAAGGTVTFSSVATGYSYGGGAGPVPTNATVGTGLTNSAVVVLLAWEGVNPVGSDTAGTLPASATYNGHAMTQLWNARNTLGSLAYGGSSAWIYANGTGDGTAHPAAVTLGFTTYSARLDVLVFGGVNQSTPNRTCPTVVTADTSSGSASITVANAVSGDMVVDGMNISGSATGVTSTKTSRKLTFDGNNVTGATSTAAATGSTAMGYTFAASEKMVTLGACALIPQ